MTRLSTSSSTWNLASTKWVHPQWFTQGCDFKWAASSRQKKNKREPQLETHFIFALWVTPRASSWTSTCTSTSTPSRTGQAIRVSNAKINATHRCQLPVTLAQVPHSDYYPIYMQRRRLFSAASWISFFKHFLISLCASAFGSYSVSIPSALCLSVTSTSTDPQTEPDTATKTGTVAGKQQLEWSFSLSPSASLYHSPFGWVPSVVQ